MPMASYNTEGVFADPLQLPSLSNFESYFVLKALAKIGGSKQVRCAFSPWILPC
jgi:hypothetical protein